MSEQECAAVLACRTRRRVANIVPTIRANHTCRDRRVAGRDIGPLDPMACASCTWESWPLPLDAGPSETIHCSAPYNATFPRMSVRLLTICGSSAAPLGKVGEPKCRLRQCFCEIGATGFEPTSNHVRFTGDLQDAWVGIG